MDMTTFLLGLLLGGIGVSVLWVLALRRSRKKPEGKTAKVVRMMAGGGGNPHEPL